MGRTAPRGAKRAPLTAKPAPSAASSKEAPGYLSSSTTGTMLDDLQLLEDAREISHAYFLAMLDWMAHSASLKQRDAISKASTLVRDDPTAENLAKATEIFYELALEAQLLGKLYPELGNEPAFLRVLAKMTVQAYLDSLAGKDYFGDADEPPTSVNSAGTDVGSQPSEQPCSCSNCRGRQKLSSEDLEGTFCAADLPQAALGEIEVAEAYNRQFDRPARKPTPSVRKKLLEKARRRRAEYDTPTSMESTMNFVGLRKPFSSTPLHELNPIRISEMQVPRIHSGRYLLCRIISPPVSGQCLSFVVEDQDGRAEHVCIFNHPLERLLTGNVLDQLLPIGQALVIREPVFARALRGKSIVIRIDSPTDYAFLPQSAALLDGAKWASELPEPNLSVELLRLKGNEHMGGGFYGCAAHLHLDNFASCHRDASIVLAYLAQGVAGPPLAEKKARYRRASALHGLRRFERALEEYTRVLDMDSDQDNALFGKAAVEMALEQSREGTYGWDQIDPLALKRIRRNDTLTMGDFFGPIKVVDMPQRQGGRGVIATRDIDAGELLLLELPFAVGSLWLGTSSYGFDLRAGTLCEGAKGELLRRLAKIIVDDPGAASRVRALYGGEAFPPSGKLSFDMQERDEPSLFGLPADVDIERLEAIIQLNALNLEEGDHRAYWSSDTTGLFLGASAFNHACGANALRRVTKHYVTIRARKPIKAGEEVTVPYIAVDAPRRLFDEIMKTHFGKAGCPCPECVAERAEDPDQKRFRKELVAVEYAAVQATVSQPSTFSKRAGLRTRMRLMLEYLEASYGSSNRSIRLTLAQQYSVYAHATETKSSADYKILVEYELKSLRCLGAEFVVGPATADIVALPLPNSGEQLHVRLIYLARDCVLCRIPHVEREVRRWIRAAWLATNMEFGWSWEYFIERQKRTLEECNLWRFVASWKPS